MKTTIALLLSLFFSVGSHAFLGGSDDESLSFVRKQLSVGDDKFTLKDDYVTIECGGQAQTKDTVFTSVTIMPASKGYIVYGVWLNENAAEVMLCNDIVIKLKEDDIDLMGKVAKALIGLKP